MLLLILGVLALILTLVDVVISRTTSGTQIAVMLLSLAAILSGAGVL